METITVSGTLFSMSCFISEFKNQGKWIERRIKNLKKIWQTVMWLGLDSVLKTRDITLPTKVHIVSAMVFLVVMYGCESWTIKSECQRIDAFKLWCWTWFLRVPWTLRRSNQSILKEINPEYSLEGLVLKLKCQYFGHLMSRANSLEKTLMLGKTEGKKEDGNRVWYG